MSAGMDAKAGGTGVSVDERIEAAMALLRRALDLIDAAKAPRELAARVQEALDALAEYRLS
jgi:hypothetical protein